MSRTFWSMRRNRLQRRACASFAPCVRTAEVTELKTLDRVVLVVAAAFVVMLSAVVLASVAGPGFPNGFAMDFFGAVSEHKLVTAAVGILMALVVLYLISAALRSEDEPTPIVVNTALGDVRISMSAIEAIVRRAARQVSGIREVDAQATGDAEGIAVSTKIQVYPDVSIPEVCERLENELSTAFTAMVGLPVKSVHTIVRGVAHERSKPRA